MGGFFLFDEWDLWPGNLPFNLLIAVTVTVTVTVWRRTKDNIKLGSLIPKNRFLRSADSRTRVLLCTWWRVSVRES